MISKMLRFGRSRKLVCEKSSGTGVKNWACDRRDFDNHFKISKSNTRNISRFCDFWDFNHYWEFHFWRIEMQTQCVRRLSEDIDTDIRFVSRPSVLTRIRDLATFCHSSTEWRSMSTEQNKSLKINNRITTSLLRICQWDCNLSPGRLLVRNQCVGIHKSTQTGMARS